ncbi:MAG TPA: AsnC family protein [Bryobacteraceae bacterium]|nr:AsnC family protein [Bryobacteraceae bacterium]
MKRIFNRQMTLKPQDLLVALKLALPGRKPAPYADLAEALGMSASEAHASVGRLKVARLTVMEGDWPVVVKSALKEFVLHGARYAFPATLGGATRGMPTGYAAAPLSALLSQPEELPPVWPDP